MGGMASAAANDVRMGLTNKFKSQAEEADYRRRTKATIARNKARDKARDDASENNDSSAASAPSETDLLDEEELAAVPTVPDPDAIGETEQALLDAQSRGRSSTIATSAKGLLSGDDSTRKRRSLMGGLIS